MLEKYDLYHFYSLMTFFLEFHRFGEHKRFDEGKKKSLQNKIMMGNTSSSKNKPRLIININCIKECFTPNILELAYG